MHISDGILDPLWLLVWWTIAVVFVAIGVFQIRKKLKTDPSYLPLLALMGAAVLVISAWHIPVPVTGSCSHPVGTPLAAILLGPFPTVVITSLVLFLQLFVGHGGLTTIGANAVSMGVVGAFSGWFTFIALRRANVGVFWAAGTAGAVGDALTYATAAFELAASLHPGAVLQYWFLYGIGFAPTQVPLVAIEFIFTGVAIRYITDLRPEMIKANAYLRGRREHDG